VPAINYYVNSSVNPPLSVVANHTLYFTLGTTGNPAPALSLVSAPAGAVFSSGFVSWTPTADQANVPNDFIFQATNSVGTANLDIPVTVTPDVPVPSLSINGGLTYTAGNMTTGGPGNYQLSLNPGFNNSGASPQYALVGSAFTFQFTGISNTSPTSYAIVSSPAGMTLDPNTGIGAWSPGVADAGTYSVTLSATNSAGTSLLTFTLPVYFTTAPTNVVVSFNSSAPNTLSNPVVSWAAPSDSTGVADYKVTVTNAVTNVATVYDTQSAATSYTLPAVGSNQNFVTVTAFDASGNPSLTSNVASLYLAALPALGWTSNSTDAIVGQPLSVQFSSNQFSYSIVSGPSAALINASTGLLTWTPTLSDLGTANVVVAAVNNNGWGTINATMSFPVYVTGPGAVLTLTAADWTPAGFTLSQGADGNVHVYLTGTTTDVVPPILPASPTSINITSPSGINLTIDSSNGNPIPTGGLTYSGAGGLIKIGSGVVTLAGPNTDTGGTTVTDGTLVAVNGSAIPTTGSVTVGASGILENGGGATNTIVGSVSGAGTAVIDAGSSLTANSINLGSLVIGGTAGSPATVTIAASDANGNPLAAAAASNTSGAAHAVAGFLQPAAPTVASASVDATASTLTSGTASSVSPISVSVAPSSHDTSGSASVAKSTSLDSVDLIGLQSSSDTGGISDRIDSAGHQSVQSPSLSITSLSSTSDTAISLDRQTATATNGMGELLRGDPVAAVFADAHVLEWAASTPASRPSTDADISLLSDDLLDAIGRQLQN
jgi:autotransporter-associated beta strand protein